MNFFPQRLWLGGSIMLICLAFSALPAVASEAVTLQLKWTHSFQFAGYYAAKEQGYYRDAGLKVEIKEAGPETNPVRDVLDGKAQYGVGTSSLILERHAGKPVVVLAVVFQQSPYEIYAAPDILTLHDLIGKRLMLEPQADELLAFLKKEGIPLDRIQQVPHSFNADDLMQGKSEAISGYVSDQPYYFKRAHYPYQTFSPRSAGIDFYGDNLFTTERELRDHYKRVSAFRAATLRGWQYAREHPDEIIELILAKYSQRHTREYLHYQSDQIIPLLQPNLIEIGYMSPDRWRHIAATYADIGLLPANYPLDGFIYNANKQDTAWVYRILGIALLLVTTASGVALYIHRVNRRLILVLEKNSRITAALSESEELWRTIIKTSPDGIAIISLAGVAKQVSDKMFAMLGYDAPEEIIGRTICEFIDPAYHEKIASRIGELLNGAHAEAAEYIMIRKDGGRFHVEINAEVLHDKDGNPRELFLINRDITDRKNREKELLAAKVAAEAASLAKSKFMAMLSHEYRTPLAIIRTNLNLLELQETESGSREPRIDIMKNAVSRLVEVMEIFFEKERQGYLDTDHASERIELIPFLDDVIDNAEGSCPDWLFVFEPGAVTGAIMGDRGQLKTALLNLLDNACKYSPADTTISIECYAEEDMATIILRDQGCGISENEMSSLFEKYRRGSGSHGASGTGVGLWIVRQIIELHGGSVTLAPGEVIGTVVTLRLPLVQ